MNETTKPKLSVAKIIEAAKQEATGSKTSSYLTTTAVVGITYTLITFIALTLTPPEFQRFTFIPLSFIFAISFSPLRYGLEELIRQLFPGIDYNSHEIIKHLNTISYSSLTLKNLSQSFFDNLQSYLNIPESAFIFKKGSGYQIKASDHFQNVQSLSEAKISKLISNAINEFNHIKNCKDPEVKDIMSEYHIQVIVPLTNNNQTVSLLLLGSKFHQQPYTTKDRKVMARISPKIAFAVKNAFQYEKIKNKYQSLINEHKTTEERLRKANKRLRHDDKLKDEFVYVTTHELKNPVTAMKGFISLILEERYGKVPKKILPAIKQINASNQQLIALLNNLLQIARNEAQSLTIKTTPVVICEVVDKVIQDLKPIADQKAITLKHSCPNPAVKIMGDPDRLNEIINNLISNALKYSSAGSVEITHEIDQDTLVTHVTDQGHGIPLKDHSKIFTRFFRVEDEAAKGIPGTGLGLFIVKQLIEKMQGQIWFESIELEGSTFSFSLPLAKTYTLGH